MPRPTLAKKKAKLIFADEIAGVCSGAARCKKLRASVCAHKNAHYVGLDCVEPHFCAIILDFVKCKIKARLKNGK